MQVFLQITTNNLTIYYSGHVTSKKSFTSNEADSLTSVMVFDNGYITDNDLSSIIKQYTNGNANIVLLADCEYSRPIWNIPLDLQEGLSFPPNIITITSLTEKQGIKQGVYDGIEQGIFTYYFISNLTMLPQISSIEMGMCMDALLSTFGSHFYSAQTRDNLLGLPIFPLN